MSFCVKTVPKLISKSIFFTKMLLASELFGKLIEVSYQKYIYLNRANFGLLEHTYIYQMSSF